MPEAVVLALGRQLAAAIVRSLGPVSAYSIAPLLRAWSARDTSEFFTGDLHVDTLVGSYRGAGGVAHFVRRR